ncbi:MAG: hypothetical protein ABGW50_02010 [Thermococcus sp.]
MFDVRVRPFQLRFVDGKAYLELTVITMRFREGRAVEELRSLGVDVSCVASAVGVMRRAFRKVEDVVKKIAYDLPTLGLVVLGKRGEGKLLETAARSAWELAVVGERPSECDERVREWLMGALDGSDAIEIRSVRVMVDVSKVAEDLKVLERQARERAAREVAEGELGGAVRDERSLVNVIGFLIDRGYLPKEKFLSD